MESSLISANAPSTWASNWPFAYSSRTLSGKYLRDQRNRESADAPLHAAELLVRLLGEAALHADHGLERRLEVRYPEVEQLRQLGDQLRVDRLEDLARLSFLLLRLSSVSFARSGDRRRVRGARPNSRSLRST